MVAQEEQDSITTTVVTVVVDQAGTPVVTAAVAADIPVAVPQVHRPIQVAVAAVLTTRVPAR